MSVHSEARPTAGTERGAPAGRRPLRIVHVVSSFEVGGMEQFVVRLAAEQLRGGHQAFVLALKGGPLLDQARALGVEAWALDRRGKLARAVGGTVRLLRQKPDIINAHNAWALTYALLGKAYPGARVVMTRHGQEEITPLPSEGELRRTDAIVAVSEAAARVMLARRPACAPKLQVIHNGVERVEPHRSRAQVRGDLGLGGEVVGIMVARLDQLKGHETLLRALALPQVQEQPLVVLLLGDGPERPRLEVLARELELGPDRLRFLGFRRDVPDLLSASDFFVLPSLTEGLPLSVLEAMAQGLPIIATPVGGIPELVTHEEHGLLVPVKEPEALADAVVRVAADAPLRQRQGRAGRERAEALFSFSAMTRRYEDLYYSLRFG